MEYKTEFVKVYALQNYLNEHIEDGWCMIQVSQPVRTSRATADLSVQGESAQHSVLVILMRAPNGTLK